MTGPAVALVVGSVGAAALGLLAVARAPRRLARENHAGRKVPAVLGVALVAGLEAGAVAGAALDGDLGRIAVAVLWAAAALGAVGVVDDLAGSGVARGFRGHLGGALRGRPTTGILKLVAGVAAGVTLAVLLGGGPVRVIAASVLVASCVNLWNALDVRPGRSLKWASVALVPLLAVSVGEGYGLVAAATLGAAAGVLPLDLAERGMLGDGGSNPLGLVIGAGLALTLPSPGVVLAAGAAVGLTLAAETVTISRVIEAVPPLRWFDRLGRRPPGTDRSGRMKSRGD